MVRETAIEGQGTQTKLSARKKYLWDVLAGAEPADAANTAIVKAIFM